MKSQEAAVYREIQKSTENAMKTIDTLSGKVYDDDFALQISRQSLKYAEIYNEASRQLVEGKAQRYQSTALSDALLKTGLHYNTLLNTSTAHLAEMMIRENNNGILEMETKYGIWELVGRLRGRNHASTMEPDLDNANVGKRFRDGRTF